MKLLFTSNIILESFPKHSNKLYRLLQSQFRDKTRKKTFPFNPTESLLKKKEDIGLRLGGWAVDVVGTLAENLDRHSV